MGPTAAGKTDIAVELTQQYSFDIISVDSALVYKGMDIGTAKPEQEILTQAPHRLINLIEPSQTYSAANFRRDAIVEIESILKNDRMPLLVGGTMLYFKVLQQGLSPLPAAEPIVREKLKNELEAKGIRELYSRLQKVDRVASERIKPTDTQRILRALEVFEITGTPLSQLQKIKADDLPYQFVNIGVVPDDRKELHQRIEMRFDKMLANGLIDEVKHLMQRGDLDLSMPSMRCVGYRQVWQYLEQKYSKDEMRLKGIVATRQLAKRQLTWLRQWPELQNYNELTDRFFTET